MEPLAVGEAIAGGALVFFLPGFVVAKAAFPERRVRGPDGVRWAIELVALGLVLSVVLTVVVGELLLAGAPGGFSASWGDPLLEAILAGVALVAFVIGWFEGAYAARAPEGSPRSREPGGDGAWPLSAELDRLQRERLGLERELRRTAAGDTETGARLRASLDRVVEEENALRQRREADYDL
jgi:hypothetical protein